MKDGKSTKERLLSSDNLSDFGAWCKSVEVRLEILEASLQKLLERLEKREEKP